MTSSIGGFVGDIVGGITGSDDAARASERGAETTAAAQREALEYLKETEARPQFYREGALDQLASFYGMPSYSAPVDAPIPMVTGGGPRGMGPRGGRMGERLVGEGYAPRGATPTGQPDLVSSVMQSPFYQQNIRTGEQAIGRNLSMTGGLRSGTANEALAQNSQQVLQNLVNQRLQGLSGMAQLPSNANQIAATTAGIGQTLGQGQIAAGQAHQAGMQGLMQLGGQLGGMAMMSDIQLKENINKKGDVDGHNWYTWTWNQKANDLGLFGESEGVIAQEVQSTNPEHVTTKHGYLAVNYEDLFNG